MRANHFRLPLIAWSGLLVLLSLVLVIAGCAAAAPSRAYAAGAPATAAEEPMRTEAYGGSSDLEQPWAPAPAPAPTMTAGGMLAQNAPAAAPQPPSAPPAGTQEVAQDVVPIGQILIYTATLHMAVFEVDKTLDSIQELARSLGGFLSHRADRRITIRVPAGKFDEAMIKLVTHGDVLHRNVEVKDVTEQYLDLSLRLKNARQVRDRIAQLLADAKNVEDSLRVEQELGRLSAEIERLEGQLNYLRDRARYSTITVMLEPVRTVEIGGSRAFTLPFPWLRDLGLGRLMNLQ